MIIGLAQTNIVWEDKKENLKNVETILRLFLDEVGNNADHSKLLVFPEMTLTGFSMNTGLTSEEKKETVKLFEQFAREFGIHIGFGWVRGQKGQGLCENHFSIVSPAGEEILDYAKIHPFSYSGEQEYFKGGEKICFCNIGDFVVSVGICFDLRFPEIFQKMSDKAHIILVPANWPERRSDHWKTLLKARAIENQCFFAGVNCGGMVGDQFYSGDSALYNPSGEIVKCSSEIIPTAKISEQKLLIYEIENTVQKVRDSFPLKRDRREALYKNL